MYGCAAMAFGCTGLVRPSSLRPPGHPMLEGISPTGLGLAAVRPRTRLRPAEVGPSRRAVRVGLDRALGRRDLDDLGLVAAAFVDVRGVTASTNTLDRLRRASRPRRGPARPGDLLVLHAAPDTPAVCVARRRLKTGVLEAACVTRGAVRKVRFDVAHPNQRRRGRGVVNSFLRPIRPGDSGREAYLAGALLAEVRTLLD